MATRLLTGSIGATEAYCLNDFFLMVTGDTTILYGQKKVGGLDFGPVEFGKR